MIEEIKSILEAIRAEMQKNGERLDSLQKLLSSSASKNVMTVADVARYLNITEYTVYKMTRNGKIPFKKLENGKRVYFLRDDIDKWIKQQK
jgi:excisionase family DNA binding protein|nr:MAG TPA: helix-turn-helix domain protein [Bacteriophage sp.]